MTKVYLKSEEYIDPKTKSAIDDFRESVGVLVWAALLGSVITIIGFGIKGYQFNIPLTILFAGFVALFTYVSLLFGSNVAEVYFTRENRYIDFPDNKKRK